MDDLGFIVASYVVTFASVALYARGVLHRSRKAARDVPRDKRTWLRANPIRWMTSVHHPTR